jgi:hypothetical protein
LGGRRRYRLAAMTAAAARDGKNCKVKEVPHGVSPGRGSAERRLTLPRTHDGKMSGLRRTRSEAVITAIEAKVRVPRRHHRPGAE